MDLIKVAIAVSQICRKIYKLSIWYVNRSTKLAISNSIIATDMLLDILKTIALSVICLVKYIDSKLLPVT